MSTQFFKVEYYCPDCDIEWSDTWDCACDDECPSCGKVYTALNYEEATTADQ